MKKKLIIGLSACLAGEKVRYDGGHRKDNLVIDELGKCFEFQKFCPEVAIGMGVPRPPVRIVEFHGQQRVRGVKDESYDVTEALQKKAQQQFSWIETLNGYIVKKNSPSCGMERVKVYKGEIVKHEGKGVFTKELIKNFPLLPIEEEGRLRNPALLDSFIQRVYAYAHWKQLIEQGLTVHDLIQFHTSYKMILLSRNQKKYRQLGRIIANLKRKDLDQSSKIYIATFMEVLAQPATRSGNVNVLQHLQGFLKRQLQQDEKKTLIYTIEKYAKGELPLIAPKVLLNHYFSKSPHCFVDRSLYLKPYPVELGVYLKL